MSANATLGTEVNKLQKELEHVRGQRGDGSQMSSLQEELERLRAELREAYAQRKNLEEEHDGEKRGLTQVREERCPTYLCF